MNAGVVELARLLAGEVRDEVSRARDRETQVRWSRLALMADRLHLSIGQEEASR